MSSFKYFILIFVLSVFFGGAAHAAPECIIGHVGTCPDFGCGAGGNIVEFRYTDGSTAWAAPAACAANCGYVNVTTLGGLPTCPPSVNGSCGTSHGGTFPNGTPPSTNLCGVGTATSVTTNPTTYTWSCNGSGGGSNASCTATRSAATVNGSCGATNNTCTAGTPSGFSAGSCGGNATWSCNGSGGGSNASCSNANPACAVNGSCGAAHGATFPNATPPSTNLCNAGTATAVTTNTSTYTWSCNGSGGGSNASCTATRAAGAINGSCGATNNTCTAGTPSGFSAGSCGGNATWTCNGSGGGSNASCARANAACPVNGSCGMANGNSYASAPHTPSALCDVGAPSAVSGTGPWTWTCAGANGGAAANCSSGMCTVAENGVCGSANGTSRTTAPTTNLCSAGTATSVTGSGPWNWSCNGSGGGTNAACSATIASCPMTPPATTGHVLYTGNGQTFNVTGPVGAKIFVIGNNNTVNNSSGGSYITIAGNGNSNSIAGSGSGYREFFGDNNSFSGFGGGGSNKVASIGANFSVTISAGGGSNCVAGYAPVVGTSVYNGGTPNNCSGTVSWNGVASGCAMNLSLNNGAFTTANNTAAGKSGTAVVGCANGSFVVSPSATCTVASPGCTVGPEVLIGDWDGWAGDMSSPGPGNICQGANYIAVAHGGTGVMGDYADTCSGGTGSYNADGKCFSRIVANCGGNLSCASNCQVYARNCQ